jgi:cyclopropane-fatty-acyl-phospholipid synthase
MPEPARRVITRYFAASGVDVDGPKPTDVRVHDPAFYTRVLAEGSVGFGESYMDGWWDADDLDGFITLLLARKLDEAVRSWGDIASFAWARLANLQRRGRAFQVGQRHYDLGDDLYERMLDRRMIYSCAYWDGVDTLDAAQENKLDLVFGKLGLKGGDSVLDIGCGWGGSLKYAVERHGVRGLGITVSKAQADAARAGTAGMPIEIRLADYRDLDARVDHVFSIGMFEHVGSKNYRTYLQVVRRCLEPGGRFLLHTVGSGRHRTRHHIDPWLEKHIFPNAVVPLQQQILDELHGLFWVEGWQRIGPHYVPTLLAWRDRFERAWPELSKTRDERFYRMWRYYLSSVAAAFRAGNADVWQVLLTAS